MPQQLPPHPARQPQPQQPQQGLSPQENSYYVDNAALVNKNKSTSQVSDVGLGNIKITPQQLAAQQLADRMLNRVVTQEELTQTDPAIVAAANGIAQAKELQAQEQYLRAQQAQQAQQQPGLGGL